MRATPSLNTSPRSRPRTLSASDFRHASALASSIERWGDVMDDNQFHRSLTSGPVGTAAANEPAPMTDGESDRNRGHHQRRVCGHARSPDAGQAPGSPGASAHQAASRDVGSARCRLRPVPAQQVADKSIEAADESTSKPDSVLIACAIMDGHPSGTAVANGLVRPTRRLGRAALERLRRCRTLASTPSSWPCSRWGLPSHASHLTCWWSLTPPFHPYRSTLAGRSAVCFLWHCPAGHPGWALPTTLPHGVRTFLDACFISSRRGRPVGSSAAWSG